MANYKERICEVCGNTYKPTSPTQKSCDNKECRKKIKRLAERRRYKRDKVIYVNVCPICGVLFRTSDSRKKYCGSQECDIERCRIKNLISEENRREARAEYRKKYYAENREKILANKKKYYENKHKEDLC